ncbi:hypothetical protein D3C75_1007180 [compost metagenome]
MDWEQPDEADYCDYQTFQVGRRARGHRQPGGRGSDRVRGQGLRSPEGAHRIIPGGRVPGRLPAEGKAGDRHRRRERGRGDRGHLQGGLYRQDRGRQDLRL